MSLYNVTTTENPYMIRVMNTFGEKLRTWRDAKDVSGWMIEKVTGIHRTSISNIEHGRRPASEDVIKKLASMPEMDITYEELKAWQAIDQYGPEILARAFIELEKQDPELVRKAREIKKKRSKPHSESA